VCHTPRALAAHDQPRRSLSGASFSVLPHLACDTENSQTPKRPPPPLLLLPSYLFPWRFALNHQNDVDFAPPNKGRFVRENQVYDDDGDANLEEGDGDVATATTLSRELLCRIPEETLFQLQQIYEALEESNGISSNGSGGSGGVGGTRGEGSRRKSTSSLPSLTNLIYGSSGGGVDEMAVEEPVGPGGDADAEGSSRSIEKPTKVCLPPLSCFLFCFRSLAASASGAVRAS